MERATDRAVDPSERLQHALDIAYRFLGLRDRTVAEVRRRLEREAVEAQTADDVIAELERQGYLDDARLARRFTQDRRTLDAWGTDRIDRKLTELGVAPELREAALAARDGESELEAAVALLRRRWPAPPQTPRDREKALGLLVRKGYELELAYDAIRSLERAA